MERRSCCEGIPCGCKKDAQVCAVFAQFGHPSLLKRHWTAIFEVLGKVYDPEKDTPNLGDLIEWGLLDEKHHDELDEICGSQRRNFSP